MVAWIVTLVRFLLSGPSISCGPFWGMISTGGSRSALSREPTGGSRQAGADRREPTGGSRQAGAGPKMFSDFICFAFFPCYCFNVREANNATQTQRGIEMATVTDKNEFIDHQLCNMGFGCTSVLVKDDFDGRDGQSHWKVTITRNGKSFDIDYSMGCAHRHYRNGKKIQLGGRLTNDRWTANKASIPDKPNLRDILHCVVSDAQSVAYGPSLEDWCGEFGYDTDSRKAERAYNACRDEYFALVRLGADFDVLTELFQDY